MQRLITASRAPFWQLSFELLLALLSWCLVAGQSVSQRLKS